MSKAKTIGYTIGALLGTTLAGGAIYMGVKKARSQSINTTPYSFTEEFFPDRRQIQRMHVRN